MARGAPISASPPPLRAARPRRSAAELAGEESPQATSAKNFFLASPPSPPQPPRPGRRGKGGELEEALQLWSVPLVAMVFTRTHCCRGNHFVFEAVKRMHYEALHFLLEEGGADADVDEHCGGQRPLHLAIQQCRTQGDLGHRMATLLLERGARPNRCSGDSDKLDPPLHDAAKRGSVAAVELLLARGASPDDVAADGRTAFHALCMNSLPMPISGGSARVLDLLMANGACPVKADARGLMPMMYAQDLQLSKRVASAEQWWSRRELMAARNWSHSRGENHADEAADIFQETIAVMVDGIMSFV